MAVNNDRIVFGGDLMFFVSSGTTYRPLGYGLSSTLNINMNTVDINSRDSGDWEDFIGGKFSWDGSEDVVFNFYSGDSANSGSTGVDELFDYFVGKKIINVRFGIKTTTSTTPNWSLDATKKYWSGQCMITSMKLDSKDGEKVGANITFKGKGALTKV